MAKVKPLTKRAMSLNQLQLRTLDVLRKVKFQFGRQAHEEGMSDAEFIEKVIDPLSTDIYQDRHVLRMKRSST
jgi:hypothetical protein